ncbi:glutathione-dependent formaldehyde dehydrogenase, partial [Pseudomonas aeruginosa]
CARMLGAERIFIVDHHPYRLAFAARTYGAIPIDFDQEDDPAAAIIERTDGHRGGIVLLVEVDGNRTVG